MKNQILINWFRQDLRLSDNPSLSAAAAAGKVLSVYILDDLNSGTHKMGAASRWWLHNSLAALNKSLDGNLLLLRGDPLKLIPLLANLVGASGVYWNRCYEPWRISRDKLIRTALVQKNIKVASYNGSLLWEPWNIKKSDGNPYRVFTPFYRKGCLAAELPRQPLPKPESLCLLKPDNYINSGNENIFTRIKDLKLLSLSDWNLKLNRYWKIGENAAHIRLETFLGSGIENYKEDRNIPANPCVSRLSSHLHWGEISPNIVWQAVIKGSNVFDLNDNADHFLSELGWREFSYNLLYHFPELPVKNLQSKFDHFPWRKDLSALARWQ